MGLPIYLLSDNFVKTKHITEDMPFQIEEINARELLCPERLDLAAKIAYIEARENGGDMHFAEEAYRKHIEAFSDGYYTEPGDESKNSLDKFLSVFDELIDEFRDRGFDPSKSLIPVGKNNIILDGAHRTACAIFFNKTVSIIRFPQFEVNFNYEYFRSKRLSEEMLRYMAVKYSQYAQKNLYFACFWPVSAESKRPKAIKLISDKYSIVLDSTMVLSKNGLRNFMLQIYQHQDWVGTPENHFSGVMGKVDACFAPGGNIETVMFEGGNLEDVLAVKNQIREMFHIDKHAIHISDSSKETNLIADSLWNENSIHALNYGKPDYYPEIYSKLREKLTPPKAFNRWATLAYYGITEEDGICSECAEYDPFNPRTFFVFDGQKLPALAVVKGILSKSGDRELYTQIANLLQSTGGNTTLRRKMEDVRTTIAWKIQQTILRSKQIGMRITQRIGIYHFLHKLLHR